MTTQFKITRADITASPASEAGQNREMRRAITHRNAKQIWNEGEDGWWAILKDGLVIDGCVGVHEETKTKLLSRLNDARPGEEQ